ncbi:MAG: hypothetical protein U0P30_17800 [Vicinamibacterales bacterium]
MPQIPFDFVLFGLTLLGVALFHHHTLKVAVGGLTVITLYKVLFAPFGEGAGLAGLGGHLVHEWVVIANLGLLLTGFALLARHFEESGVPEALPRVLPDGWTGGFALLVLVFVLSSFLDNIAAALIGATVAKIVFPEVHIGYLAAIVAASNAGGSGSVVGDTTTTMMWIDGVAPLDVTHAYAAAMPALAICGLIAARQQHAFAPMRADAALHHRIDWGRIAVVGVLLVTALAANIGVNAVAPALADQFPILGVALWLALIATAGYRRPDWAALPGAVTGAIFLLSLVLAASMMPVERLPPASWQTAFGLGFVSAVFDNIPLTALALRQGGYDWGVLAYAVGYGGSMIWFGSSAGVAVTNVFPQAKSVAEWVRQGWHVTLAYVVGFAILLLAVGWHPHAPHRGDAPASAPVEAH